MSNVQKATQAVPGSKEKIAILRQRFEAGQPLFNCRDLYAERQRKPVSITVASEKFFTQSELAEFEGID